MEPIQHLLEELLQAHGLQTTIYKEWILVDGKLPGIAASFVELNNRHTVQLNIDVVVSRATLIVESFAGTGTSVQEAILNAMENFSANSLHVFLAAFWDQVTDQQVTLEQWEINDAKWQVFIGNFGLREYGGFQVAVPENVFPTLERLVRQLPLEGDLHWVRTIYCNMPGGNAVTEVLHNNKPWEVAQNMISRLEWPRTDKYYSVRNFLIMRREEFQT